MKPILPKFIELPAAPQNASPVPELNSIHAARRRGPYGSARYRGNCGGYLIRDLLRYYQPKRVLDPMTGSGTCRDVCLELSIPCVSMDVRSGQDAADYNLYDAVGDIDFVWIHPPYWRMIVYNDDPLCLSAAPTLDAFFQRLRLVLRNCRRVLTRRGKIAVLIGGYSERGVFQPLPHLTVVAAAQEGLRMAGTEIIRLQYGNTSSKRTYRSSFIPGPARPVPCLRAGQPLIGGLIQSIRLAACSGAFLLHACFLFSGGTKASHSAQRRCWRIACETGVLPGQQVRMG